MPPVQDDASATAQQAPAPGMLRVDEMTIDKFNDDQRSGLKQANMERKTRGNPEWLIADYVRVHPGKFPDVDFDLDHREAVNRAASAPQPNSATRRDQRAVE